jgi:hypothetical protein
VAINVCQFIAVAVSRHLLMIATECARQGVQKLLASALHAAGFLFTRHTRPVSVTRTTTMWTPKHRNWLLIERHSVVVTEHNLAVMNGESWLQLGRL